LRDQGFEDAAIHQAAQHVRLRPGLEATVPTAEAELGEADEDQAAAITRKVVIAPVFCRSLARSS
jgi:hypothetical protein